jgi:hypothetical protein
VCSCVCVCVCASVCVCVCDCSLPESVCSACSLGLLAALLVFFAAVLIKDERVCFQICV